MYQAQHEVSHVTHNDGYKNDGYNQRGDEGHRGGYRGNGGRGRGRCTYNKRPACTLCWPNRHTIDECRFNTPAKRRNQLVVLGRCQACGTRNYEHGSVCSHKARCHHHKGESHLTYTCEGPQYKHPGPQVKYPMPQTPPQNPSEVKIKAQAENNATA